MKYGVQETTGKQLFFHLVANESVLFGSEKDAFRFNDRDEAATFIELSELPDLETVELKALS